MWVAGHLHSWLVRLTTRRYRRILVASLVTLGTSAVLLGLVSFIQWRGRQALQSDTHTLIAQSGQQLIRALQSRRGTLTFLRDTLNRRSDLTLPQLQALGSSAVQHTRDLLAAGLMAAGQVPVWWSGPAELSKLERARLNRAIVNRVKLRGAWRRPSTFVTTPGAERPLLVMLEPLRATAASPRALIGVFDVQPLLEDFFVSNLSPRYPVQLLDGDTLLYRSPSWQPAVPPPALSPKAPPSQTGRKRPDAGGGIVVERPVHVAAARWTIQMLPGSTRVAQTLSWVNILLIVLSVIAGAGVTVIVWILAIRTWVLQRAVAHRTAALRRTSERLRQMAITDELTGLHNRRFFLNRWEWEFERAKRYQRPLVCLMVDVNGFKEVNDRLGHPAGDLVLKQVAQELKTALRQSDILARFGGDEFIVALPETSLPQAELVAEKLRQISIAVPAADRRRQSPPVNLSVGISRVDQDDESAQDILNAADQSLYEFKRRLKAAAAR